MQSSEPREALKILCRDEYLVVINKPSGLLVHKSPLDKHLEVLLKDLTGNLRYDSV